MQEPRSIEIQCLYTDEKRHIKPTSKGFRRTKDGKVFWHCLLRDDCMDHIGCHGQIFITPEEQERFLPEELENMPVH